MSKINTIFLAGRTRPKLSPILLWAKTKQNSRAASKRVQESPYAYNFYIYKMKRSNNWTDQQDELLLELHGQADCFQKWKYIAQKMGARGWPRNEIQCRERFVNKVNPELRLDKLDKSEIRCLFQYYDQYGPLWSVFESLIPGRSQNLLKNKFYSTLRTLVRLLLTLANREPSDQNGFFSASISSKLLVDIYEGKKNFRKFKGFLATMLKKLDFELDLQKIARIDNETNIKIIKNIRSEIGKSLGCSKKATGRRTAAKGNQKDQINKKQEIKDKELNANLQEETKEKVPELREISPASGQEEQWSQPCFGFCYPLINHYNFYMPMWGFIPAGQSQSQEKPL